MDDTFLAQLRCPLDPTRNSTLARDGQELVCSRCAVRFPIRQGLPVLVPSEAELPANSRELSQLPCRRAAERQKGNR
jgi:uncharacterized protein YbaR (Trm112 family)